MTLRTFFFARKISIKTHKKIFYVTEIFTIRNRINISTLEYIACRQIVGILYSLRQQHLIKLCIIILVMVIKIILDHMPLCLLTDGIMNK